MSKAREWWGMFDGEPFQLKVKKVTTRYVYAPDKEGFLRSFDKSSLRTSRETLLIERAEDLISMLDFRRREVREVERALEQFKERFPKVPIPDPIYEP